tara:strand:- start:2927 stop:3310 length:384 start_codon:yes stop_codon:yes gene_type:complete
MAISAYLDRKILEHVLGIQVYTPAAQLYLGLYNGDPATGGVEVSGGGYSRRYAEFSMVSNSKATNALDVDFQVLQSWGTVTHLAVGDADTGGNLLVTAPLSAPLNTGGINQIILRSGDLTIELQDSV